MDEPKTVDDILDFAIAREQEAVEFYSGLAGQAQSAAMKEAFLQFAGEERGHKAKLEHVKQGKRLLSASQKVADLKIADYTVTDEVTPQMSYQDVLLVAMSKEKAAFRLYSDLAASTDDAELKDLLLGLAQEEAKHKLRFEVEYDEHVYSEN